MSPSIVDRLDRCHKLISELNEIVDGLKNEGVSVEFRSITTAFGEAGYVLVVQWQFGAKRLAP